MLMLRSSLVKNMFDETRCCLETFFWDVIALVRAVQHRYGEREESLSDSSF